jgi:broad specificity phosphatase PhoE
MKIYFVRHGESEANVLRVISNRDLPYGLTVTGRKQAEELAKRLCGKPISCIYSSPIPRARQTGEVLSIALNVAMKIVDALREPDCGILEGRGDASAWAQHKYWMETWLAGRSLNLGPLDGEIYNMVRERFVRFIDELVEEYGNSQAECILVTHGELLLFGLPGVLRNVDHQYILNNGVGHTTIITTELCGRELVCVAWEN